MLLKPERLRLGDTVGVIAPASPPPDPKNLDRAVAALARLGFKVKLGPNVRRRHGFLAGSDGERAADLLRMFADRDVKAILCVRGGYGAARLLPLLDYQVIRRNPKIFVGHSDITALHCALLTRAGLISFHGPMLNSDFAKKDMPDFTLRSFLRTVMQPEAPGRIAQRHQEKSISVLRGGKATGPLVGGNLTLLCMTIGTPWQPQFRGRILFLEDVDEQPYRFDRMLTYLLNCGLLQQIAGIAVGVNRDCEDPKARLRKEFRQSLADVLSDRLRPLKVPVVTGLPFGHVPLNATLPLGITATLDARSGDLILNQSAVR